MKILFISLGCDKNLADSEEMLGLLTGSGHEIVDSEEEAEAIEAIEKAGYKVKFQLLPDVSIGYWSDFKSKFGF